MGSSSRKGTTRRVTAQRKFAQGAYVPPTTAATPSTSNVVASTSVRREAPAATQDKNNAVFSTPMSAKNLLDVVCFKSTHAHMQPIVLVERLREENNEKEISVKDNDTVEVPKVRKKIKRKILKKPKPKPHIMQLRDREQRRIARKMVTQVTFGNASTSTVLTLQQTKDTLVKPKMPKKIPSARKKNPPRTPVKRGKESVCARCITKIDGFEFSLDDNRPLKYFAKSNTKKAASVDTVMGPPTKIPALTRKQSLEKPIAHSPVIEVPSRIPMSTKNTTFGDTASELIQELVWSESPPNDTAPSKRVEDIENNVNDSQPEHNYYGEYQINRWLDGSMPEQTESKAAARPRETEVATCSKQVKPVPSRPPETPLGCPAFGWTKIKDITDATKIHFDSRCRMCTTCKIVQKMIKLSSLLMRQRKIDCSGIVSDAQMGESSRDNAGSRPTYTIINLVPQHQHLMIRIKTLMDYNNTPIYKCCLIPRVDTGVCHDFDLVANEELIRQSIIGLSLTCGHGPPESDKDNASVYSDDSDLENYVKKPSSDDTEEEVGVLLEAPVFYPTKEEFADPLAYIETIWNKVLRFGICKICPPHGFFPTCKADDDMCFEVSNQYIARTFNRWGSGARKMSALKASLQAQSMEFIRPPKLEGVELNLPRLYNAVQRHGGLEKVFNEKKWGKVSDAMKLNTNPFTERKLERIYTKYILPYDTMSPDERLKITTEVEIAWFRKHKKLLKRASNPLHDQKRLLGDSESSNDESDGKDEPHDAEDCVKPGCNMNLAQFKKTASICFYNYFRNLAVNTKQIEDEYWEIVINSAEHVCVNSASIDTGELGLGFTTNKNDEYCRHPWNLKMLSENPRNVLRSLGPALGVTVPTLHLGMIFSTSCWHRDPHSIPWMEYLHQGSIKLWYGVPETQDKKLRDAIELLHPSACQNKALWLPSDISMIPPKVLLEQNVRLCRLEQKPGEFVLVMPRAYSCSVSTGYTVSESAYFATQTWLKKLMMVFNEIRDSCEPTMFSIEQLLKSIAEDPRTSVDTLRNIQPAIDIIFHQEIANRQLLMTKGVKMKTLKSATKKKCGSRASKRKKNKASSTPPPPPVWNVRDQDECELCRCTLYLSKVKNLPTANSLVCLTHALQLLSKQKYASVNIEEIELLCAYDTENLLETLRNTHQRLGKK